MRILFFLLATFVLSAQTNEFVKGQVLDKDGELLTSVQIYDEHSNQLATTDSKGYFQFMKVNVTPLSELTFFLEGYQVRRIRIPSPYNGEIWKVQLLPLSYQLSEVVLREHKRQQASLRKLRDVEGMTINAGKKTEVVLLEDMTLNKTTNNARQIFSKVVGLTINEGSDGGLQLNIGGRGLNPNRTANFNTRQNGYDISADVLGYPESYYTPAAEGIREIQVIRGAASLQYGTQFGGMVNFIMKQPSEKALAIKQNLSLGSYGLFSSFTELSGTTGKFSYYTFYNYKQGNGYRENSNFKSHNGFANLNYQFDDKNSLHLDWLKFHYLAQQPGGLTDYMFYQNPRQSNRERNWFTIDWNILNLRYQHNFSAETRFSIQAFGLQAYRKALGYRDKRASTADKPNSQRDLLIGTFKNWGAEARFITNYTMGSHKNSLLVGAKYYQSKNGSQQGPGSSSSEADFRIAIDEFPYYERQSEFTYPNLNLAFFAENIFRLSDKTTLTPGLRIEKIRTESDGWYRVILENAGKIISNYLKEDYVVKDRNVFLLGVGFSHKQPKAEWYANLSQNYRSVTFSDIHSHIIGLSIAPDITDEKGFSSDIGVRGKLAKVLQYDTSIYALYYGGKIGEYLRNAPDGSVERYRDNVGDALTYGFETLWDWDINQTFLQKENFRWNAYVNVAVTGSKYVKSEVPNIQGNEVEFVPLVNLKSGIGVGYKNFIANLQGTFVSAQFTEATNQVFPKDDNTLGLFGTIPPYYVMDISASYKFNKHFSLEGSLQNFTNHQYFTRRATGYPGPGIIPSEPINGVITLSIQY